HHLREIAGELHVPVQYGGGLRSVAAVTAALHAGADRAIVGTVALTDPPLLDEILAAHGPSRVRVSVDVRGGRPTASGWVRTADANAEAVLERLRDACVEWFVY